MKKNMLKKWFIIGFTALFLSLSAIGLTACTDDEETESSTDTTIFPEVELPWDEF
ncbi:MAG: hypothetical protein J6K63_08565 [Clostridia bacterium]|nr:hypothetical protein [Clostridia bacterium]